MRMPIAAIFLAVLAPATAGRGAPAAPQRSAAPVVQARQPGEPAEEVLREIGRRKEEEERRRRLLARMSRIRQRIRRQFAENEDWYDEAVERETDLVREAEERFEDKDFRGAKRRFMEALAITYPQWVFADRFSALIKGSRAWYKQEGLTPSFQKKRFHLSTEYTRLALTRLPTLDTLIDEYDLAVARLAADKAHEEGKLREAYRRYGEALKLARRMGRNELAMKYADELARKREAMLAEAARPLAAAEKALKAGNPATALTALEEFKKDYIGLLIVGPLLTRYRALEADPAIRQERKERAAVRKIALADAAIAREDYRRAVRWYLRAALAYPDTRAGKLAARKRKELLDDPQVVKAIELQKAKYTCKAMLARAATFAKWGKTAEAVEVYNDIIAKYPDTTWAKEAAAARDELGGKRVKGPAGAKE